MAKTLTTKDLQSAFGVTAMTIHNWRQGAADREPLPVVQRERPTRAVDFEPAAVRAWAKKHGIAFDAAHLRPRASPRLKPGPRRAES